MIYDGRRDSLAAGTTLTQHPKAMDVSVTRRTSRSLQSLRLLRHEQYLTLLEIWLLAELEVPLL